MIDGFNRIGKPYIGFLYAGLMIDKNGKPFTLEFNCRLGDPETQPIMMRLKTDLIDLVQAALAKRLHEIKAAWDPRPALTVILAANGYPESYEKGNSIIVDSPTQKDQKIFHAGTLQKNQHILINGGRVLAITALGGDLTDARKNAYSLAKAVAWPDCHFRTDIGL